MTQHNDVTTKKKRELRKRRQEALMYYALGMTQEQIAERQGLSQGAVSKQLARALREHPIRTPSDVITMQVLAASQMRSALQTKIEQGNSSAILAALKCMDHEAKLLGLIQNTNINITTTNNFHDTAQRLLQRINHNKTIIELPQNQNPFPEPLPASGAPLEISGG